MKIGYARVSTRDQNIDMQIDALEKEGCKRIYQEVVSGVRSSSPELDTMMNSVREGDIIVVWKLDRLGRSLKHLIDLANGLLEKKVGLKSLNDPIDTSTAQGRLTFNLFASLAEFERELLKERTNTGLTAARVRGRTGGRPPGLTDQAEATACAVETLYLENKLSVNQICKKLNIAKRTLYIYLRHRKVAIGPYRSSGRKTKEKGEYHGKIHQK